MSAPNAQPPPQYSRDDVDALLSKMIAERDALLTAALALTPQEAGAVPVDAVGEEQWTAREQLAHLWEMERSYVACCRAALETNGADVTDVRAQPVAIPIEDAPAHSVAVLVDALKQERSITLDFIRALTLADFTRTAKNAAFGELTVMQWLRSFYRHDRQHTAQIQGRRSDYAPSFQDGKEPDQRRQRIALVRRRAAARQQSSH